MSWLLLFVPIAAALEEWAPERYLLLFAAAGLAILPLAGWMGRATEQLASRLGEGVGGLLNATFGNAAELIISLAALRAGLHEVVKASLAGSIIGNVLLVLGAAMLAGGLRHPEQHFNAPAARSQATMLTLAAISLILPAAYRSALGSDAPALGSLSVWISIVLLGVYALNLRVLAGDARASSSRGRAGRGGGPRRGVEHGPCCSGPRGRDRPHRVDERAARRRDRADCGGSRAGTTCSSASSWSRSSATRPSTRRRSARRCATAWTSRSRSRSDRASRWRSSWRRCSCC